MKFISLNLVLISFLLVLNISATEKINSDPYQNIKTSNGVNLDHNLLGLKNELIPDNILITESYLSSAMPNLKQTKLGKVLTRFYNKCFGGSEVWDKFLSLQIHGKLNTVSGIYEYTSIAKKPNLYKISIKLDGKANIFTSNGVKKWQQIIGEEESFLEVDSSMTRMIYEPELPINLLYPFQHGKHFQYEGVARESNTVCFIISLLTDSDYLIHYFIDIESYLIVSIHIVDRLDDFRPTIIKYSDYNKVDGMYLANQIQTFVDGVWDSTLIIDKVSTNVGATNWLFNPVN